MHFSRVDFLSYNDLEQVYNIQNYVNSASGCNRRSNFYLIDVKVKELDKPDMSASQQAQCAQPLLEAGSAVEFGDPLQHGIIHCIKIDPVLHKEIAEVEMVSYSAKLQNCKYT